MNLERWRHNTRKRLRHRRQINDYKIEMFFIIDYAVYKYWYTQSRAADMRQRDAEAKNNIRQFYTFVINGMDVRYKNIQTSAFKISILFSGIYIADTPSKSQFIEKLKANSASGYQVDSNAALKAVTSWVKGTPGLPNYDHAMMFTRYDFTSTGSSDTTGLAWLGTLCTDQAVSVVEDHFNFNVITVAAHELGHGLSAKHDGSGNSCNSDDAFVMAPSTIPVDNQNPWKFSACSTYYFTNYINKLNRDNNNCMTVLSQDFDPDALKQYTALPGEIYDADAQCRHIVGPNSGFCKSIYRQNFMSVCTKLWCTRGDGSNGCVSAVAGDGIQCGNKKWCISGVCKYDECAPPGDESCLYGDREGVAITYNGVDVTCSFEDIKKNPAVCYSVNTTCCRQCRNFYTGIIGCEYGDRATGCSKSHCPGNPSLCCGTCYNGTLSTPSYQPTTQKNLNLCKMKATTPSTTSNIEGYRNYLIYGGAVAVNLVLLIVICICGLYHKRKQKHKSVPNSKLSGFTNRAMEYM
ncbi:A disintegrin and metalloproteinase with thrombospondin motifs 14-like [Saccostrea echinata]|uniref:A disintegrin and metalloproteinase with thrombospondin motifs 14-like n=1 Tax=Saccostrea echinata TaxID=191078 RepID=UPI002A831874|nr:A disintegrin and metalloproteinase with thrombospondin motifs 14-like [Saccostrea echinata]